MAGLTDLVKNFTTLNIKREIQIGVEKTAKQLADKQRDQMLHGLRSTGKQIGKYKNKGYATKKFSQNSLAGFGNIDLRDKGDFQRDILIDARDEGVVIISADSKTEELIGTWGENIFGLTDENAAEYSGKNLAPVVNEQIIKHLNRV